MNQNNKGGDGTGMPIVDDVARSAFVSAPSAPPHRHQPPSATTSGITASHLAAMAASSNNYAPVDHNAAFMMSNAAATIAAVAASAVQQMTQAKTTSGTTGTTSTGGPSATLPTSLYHAALHGNRNALIPGAAGAQQVQPVPHAALLTALANAGQTATVQAIPSPQSAPGHTEAATSTTSSLLRPNAPVLSQPSSTLASPALLSDMQSWSLEQLDQHIALLQQMNQSVPHSVAILRAEAERKIKKKNDKRVANRKSASNSRARKKALVEEMTKTNARLKKQAMILALLPDLVMTTTIDGEITFCSAQAERILRYKTDELVGAKLYNLLVPSSRHALKSLIDELVHPGKAKAIRASVSAQARRVANRKIANQNDAGVGNGASKNTAEINNGNSNGSARDSSRTGGNSTDDTSGVAIVSEQSFPLSVVEVESKQQSQQSQRAGDGSNENLDSSTSNSAGSGEDDGIISPELEKKKSNKTRAGGDDYSTLSSETKNLRANNNLDRNVRWHNHRMMLEGNKKIGADNGPKDDVTGASVTANNATARLSSLEHCPKTSRGKKREEPITYESPGDQSSSDDSLLAGVEEKKKSEDASDDSGYRESNDSREESSSSWSDTSRSNDHRKKPLAPTCRMCLIRDDLTTVWCEVTSSIRNKSSDEDAWEEKAIHSKSPENSEISRTKIDQELLLCLRPIRNSGKKVDESFRFIPLAKQVSSAIPKDDIDAWVSTSTYSGESNKEENVGTKKPSTKNNALSAATLKQQELYKKRPPKKRLRATSADTYKDSSNQKRAKSESANQGPNASETEKSVVESLMLMNKSSQ
jgi:PAS domain-containing protein